MVATGVAGGVAQTDARNAFCSIHRAAIQRGILRLAPELLPTFDFLYGPNAIGSCVYDGGGGSQPKGSCLVPGGVQQGDGFGSIFFGFGADEMITGVRGRMREVTSKWIAQCWARWFT